MTVPSEINRSGPYNGNGVTTVFDYEFKITNENYIKVIKADAAGVEAILTLDADYIVSDVGNPAGGQVALTVPLPTGQTLTMIPSVPFTQEIDLENQGAYYAETVERGLDLAVLRDQQLQEQISRAVQIPASEDPAQLNGLVNDILRLADSADEIDTVANNVGAVNTAATNIAAIIAAPAQAAAAAASATAAANSATAASGSATAAGGSATAAATSAASINLPAVVANTMLIAKSDATGYDAKPKADVRNFLASPVHVADRVALKALDPTKDTAAFLKEAGRENMFKWMAGAAPIADPGEGVFIASDVTGHWRRRLSNMIDPTDFGVVGDGVTDDSVAFQRCVTFAAGRDICIAGLTIRIPAGNEITVPSTGLTLRGRGKIVYEGTGSLFKAGTFTTTTYSFTATAGQTVFAAADSYTGAYVEVYQNGALRPAWSNTITHDVTNITATFLSGGAALNDNVQIKVTRATVSGLAAFSQVIVGSGVDIVTTQINAGRAFQLAWPDTAFLPGRQYTSFVMETGAIIRGNDGTKGFSNAIWLHGSYNVRIGGEIFGVGGNLIPAGDTANDTKCSWAIYVTGEWTSSDFHLYAGSIGFYYAGIGSLFSTIEGIQIVNFTFLEVGYATYWEGRSNDTGLMLAMHGCHANTQLGVAFCRNVAQSYIIGNDFFQSTKSTKQFFRYVEYEVSKEVVVAGNTFRSFVNGANTIAVVARTGCRGLRGHNNIIVAADATSVASGFQAQSGSYDCVWGPNTYENVDQAAIASAGSERIGVVTEGDVFLTPPGVTNPRYSLSGNNWWQDRKWLIVQNAGAQSIANTTITSWAYTEVRDPESIYTSGTIATPAWATRARMRGSLKWAANATGQRFMRLVRGGSVIEFEQTASISPADNTAVHSFDVEFAVAAGNTLDIQVYQASGGALNLNVSQMQVLFT